MTLSVKPFGCMPSSGVSDGVQSVITELYPDAIFCPVETNGDGAVKFYSRVQMYLFKARQRAQEEFQAALDEYGVTEEQVREYLREHPRMNHPFALPPHRAAGTGADLVHEVGPYIGKSRLGRARIRAGRMAESAKTFATKTFPQKAGSVRKVMSFLPSIVRYAASEVGEKYPRTRELFEQLLAKAVELNETEQRSVAAAQTRRCRRARRAAGCRSWPDAVALVHARKAAHVCRLSSFGDRSCTRLIRRTGAPRARRPPPRSSLFHPEASCSTQKLPVPPGS
jgi:hypothetical protein